MTTGEIAVWCDTMAPVAYESGRAAVLMLKNHQDWPPTHHQFLEAANDHAQKLARARMEAERSRLELELPPVDPEVAVENIRKLKAQVAGLMAKQKMSTPKQARESA